MEYYDSIVNKISREIQMQGGIIWIKQKVNLLP